MFKLNIFFTLLVIISFVCALTLGGYLFFCLFYVLFVLFIINVIFIKVITSDFDIDIIVENKLISAGEDAKITTIVKCGQHIPVPYVRISGSLFGDDNFQTKSEVFSIPADENKWIKKKINFPRRGLYNCGVFKLNIRDTFNISNINLNIEKNAIIKVYPRVFNINGLTMGGADIYKNTLNLISNKEDQFAVKDVRKYQQGDSLKRVHWKLSAKIGELYVRNSENISGEEVTILMDMKEKNLSLDTRGEIEESIIDTTVSIIKYLVNKNIEVRILVNGRKSEEVLIASKEQFNNYLEALITKNSDGTKEFSDFISENSYKVSKVSSIILVSAEITQSLLDNLLMLKSRGYPVTFFYSDKGSSGMEHAEKLRQWGIECYSIDTIMS